jgi:rod shape-determining protein MreD
MNTLRTGTVFVLLFWIAGGCNQGVSNNVAVFGVPPDFLLVALVTVGFLTSMRGAIISGFFGGLMQGALVGANMWQFILTRMLAGWISGFAIDSRLQRNAAVNGLLCAITTVISSIVYMLFTGQADIVGFLKATIISAMYNGVLALVIYTPVERLAGIPKPDRL